VDTRSRKPELAIRRGPLAWTWYSMHSGLYLLTLGAAQCNLTANLIEGTSHMLLQASHSRDARRNKLLAALPDIDWKRVQRNLEPVDLKLGQILSESGSALRQIYLPTTSTVSLMYITVDGESTEIAAVGNEGMVGIAVFMGGHMMPARAVVQNSGRAFRLPAEVLREEFDRGGAMQRLLLLYAQSRLSLVAQVAVCNQHHSVDQRFSRWLLSGLDRSESAELSITHELVSRSLGVRREGISEATGRMQRAGIVTSSRGRLTVIDRAALEAICCECYGVMRREYDRLLGLCARPPARTRLSSFRITGTQRCANCEPRLNPTRARSVASGTPLIF
jgi:CRP-like cAMP-binding protein